MSYVLLPNSSSPPTDVKTDGITIQGDGTAIDPVAILQVQTDGATVFGDGTVASPLSAAGGGKPQTFAFMFVDMNTNIVPAYTVPFLAFPDLSNGEWTEEINSGDWDTSAGSLRCFKDGIYKITGQMTFSLEEQQPSNTEFILRAGLVQAIDPSLPMYCQGYVHANIESNTEWKATVHFQWLGSVGKNQEFFPFIETDGDACDILPSLDFSTTFVVEEVSQ